ncbi:hypothetical protein CEXT_717581 [Caerostris extrusa]|uniref:Uncharacterized protein n=1 Tax=Caerostris extrusa TaxID=172846 RepID=A0AAV4NKT8_CAEEX|nr:hypothetical protein CEXT_717581 [Caerostris extrusa]
MSSKGRGGVEKENSIMTSPRIERVQKELRSPPPFATNCRRTVLNERDRCAVSIVKSRIMRKKRTPATVSAVVPIATNEG